MFWHCFVIPFRDTSNEKYKLVSNVAMEEDEIQRQFAPHFLKKMMAGKYLW